MSPKHAIAALALTVAAVGCGDVHSSTTHDPALEQVVVKPAPVSSTPVSKSSTTIRLGTATHIDLADYQLWQRTLWLQSEARTQAVESALLGTRAEVGASGRTVHAASKRSMSELGSGLDAVVACIYHAESGNYAEHSHPGSGSGAAQWVPGTWRAWSARAGYPGYSLAYLAPPSVQEAVLRYALTHGGAGNWSPKYGADSCTVGMGG